MPTRAQWSRRMRVDRAFARHVGEIAIEQDADQLAEKIEHRRLALSAARVPDAVYEEVLARVAAGESLHQFRSEVAIHEGQWWARRKVDPEFDARVRAAMGSKHGVRHTAEEFEAALRLICGGNSPDGLTAMGLPSGSAIRSRARRYPEFGRRYDQALAESGQTPFQAALNRNEIYATVAAVVPRWIGDVRRDDLISEMVVAVLGGELELSDVELEWRSFLTIQNRAERRWDRSLEQHLFDDGSVTLGDRIEADTAHF